LKAFTVVLSALAKGLLFLVKVTATVLTALAATIGDAGVALGGFAASAAAFGKLEFRQGAEIIKQTMSDLAKRSQETEKAMREIWGLMKEAPEGLKETEKGAKAIKQSFTGAAGEARAMNAALREMSSLSSGLMTTGFIKTGPGGKNGVPNREDWNELLGEVRSFSREFSRELADMLTDAEREWEDFFKAIGSMISRIIIERTISRPLENAINSVLDSIFRGIGGAAGGGGVQTTALAGGGILPAGYVGLVGEAGPELLMPANQARRVVSNDDLGGGITINNNFSAGVSRADLMPILAQWRAQTVAAVYDANRRGV
jgi:phage-related minor tail protein